MRKRRIGLAMIILLLPLAIVACGERDDRFPGYQREVAGAQERADGVRAHMNLKVLETAIQQHYVESGRYPGSLTDLSVVRNQGINPGLYEYDPATGRVRLR